ncbi:hypothetical protein STCU_12118 [Strigomonas culicis]|uniref:Uncharacterized protein n=1 Tax=Strigomonas culicis TaxID=28005 RepID=S9TG46_9TRYP|nr:hypothetical protein STCU_12118 [Strigomonas culicis]|eukprot:EPY15323.1 hypothetical protein STCU_12118 [Strigomonas culicis]
MTLRTAVQHKLRMGALALTVRMPVTVSVTDLDLDCHLCFNLHHNLCRAWVEPGKLSAAVFNRMSMVVAFGERKGPYAPEETESGHTVPGTAAHHPMTAFETVSSSNATTATTTTATLPAAGVAMGVTPPLHANAASLHAGGGMWVGAAGGAGGGGATSVDTSADFFSHYESSYSTADAEEDEAVGGGHGSSSVYVDETEIGQFIQDELRAVMEKKIMAPHYVSIPLELSGL